MKFGLICYIHQNSCKLTTASSSILTAFCKGNTSITSRRQKCFSRVLQILKHGFLCYRNKQNIPCCKNVLIVMVSILINKDVFELSQNELKFMVQNCNYFFINLIVTRQYELKKESEKAGLKLNIQKTKIMVSIPITSWQTDEETVETVSDFIFFWGSRITAEGDYSHEIKRSLLLGRNVMTNLDSILKSRDITLPTNIHLLKGMVFQGSCMDVRVGL